MSLFKLTCNGSEIEQITSHKLLGLKLDNHLSLTEHVDDICKSKETYGQTRGVSNLEMKYVDKLAIIGALLKAKQLKLCSYHARSHLSYIAYAF